MSTPYHWPASSRAAVTPGCTVVVRGFVSHTVTVTDTTDDGVEYLFGGKFCRAPWSKCDPSTLTGYVDPRQLDMFGGDK